MGYHGPLDRVYICVCGCMYVTLDSKTALSLLISSRLGDRPSLLPTLL